MSVRLVGGESNPSSNHHREPRWLLLTCRILAWSVCIIGLSFRLYRASTDHGVFWPDEIYQTIEQGHRGAFGYGFIPWEFRDGARSWAFPSVLGALLKVGSWLGLRSGLQLVSVAKSVMALTSAASIALALRLGETCAGALGALLAAVLVAFDPALLVYGHRCLSEVASSPFVFGAIVLAVRCTSNRRAIGAGVLAMLAMLIRYQNVIVVLAVCVLIALTRDKKKMIAGASGIGAIALLGGIVDWFTWGVPFESLATYFYANLIQNRAGDWGSQPRLFFLVAFWTCLGPLAIVVILGLVSAFRDRTTACFAAVALGYVVIHSMIPHKEYRFIAPILPLLMATSGIGLARALSWIRSKARLAWVRDRLVPALAVGGAFAIAAVWISRANGMHFRDMGQDRGSPNGDRLVWHSEEGPNLAFSWIGQQDNVCGVGMRGVPLGSSGGYSYLHAKVPLLDYDNESVLTHANYIAQPRGWVTPRGFSKVQEFPSPGGAFEVHTRQGECKPVDSSWRRYL